MKKIQSEFHLVVLLILSFSLLVSSCKKDKATPGPEEDVQKTEIILNQTDMLPGESVIVTLSSTVAKDSLIVTIAGQKMILYKIDGMSYGGILPVLPQGSYTLSIAGLESATPVSFNVPAYTPISNSEPVLTGFQDGFTKVLDSLKAAEPGSADVVFIESLQAQYNDIIGKLSAEQKIQLAYYIRANLTAFSIPKGGFARPGNDLKIFGSNPGETLFTRAKKYSIQHARLAAAAGRAGISLYVTATTSGTGAGLLFGGMVSIITVIDFATELKECLKEEEEIVLMPGVAEAIFEADEVQNDLIFNKDNTKAIGVKVTFRNVSKQDAGHTNSTIKQLLADITESYNLDTKIAEALNKAAKYLPLVKPYAPHPNPIPDQPVKETVTVPAANLSIENVSDPDIKLSYTANGDKLNVKATSTVTIEKAITFDVVYKDPALGISVKKTISAVYDSGIYAEKIELLSGNNQIGEAGKKLGNPLKVIVRDIKGAVLQGVKVEWKVKSGGGSVSSAESITDAQGIALVEWMPGANGDQLVEASAKKKDGTLVSGAPLAFTSINFNIVHKWKVESGMDRDYNIGGTLIWSGQEDIINVEFTKDNQVKFYYPEAFYPEVFYPGGPVDIGSYIVDISKQIVTISGSGTRAKIGIFNFKWNISSYSANGLILTTDKIPDGEPGEYTIREIILKK